MKKMPNDCSTPISGSDCGQNIGPKTRALSVPKSRKSYHSIVVPNVLAINARRNCARCSASDMVATVLAATNFLRVPLVVAAFRRFSRHSPNSRSVRYDFHRGEAPEQEISTTYPCGSQIVGLPPCRTEYTQCQVSFGR